MAKPLISFPSRNWQCCLALAPHSDDLIEHHQSFFHWIFEAARMLTENGSLQSSFGIQSSWLPIRKFKVDYTRKTIGCGNGCGPKNHLDSCHLRCRTSRTMSYVMHVRCIHRTCDVRHRVEHRTYDVVHTIYRM